MAGPVPAIHAFTPAPKDVDGRDEPGHDGAGVVRMVRAAQCSHFVLDTMVNLSYNIA